jgi:hypothetical protein
MSKKIARPTGEKGDPERKMESFTLRDTSKKTAGRVGGGKLKKLASGWE